MSSYKRIPGNMVQKSKDELLYNGSSIMPEELYKKTNVQEYIEESKKRIKDEELKMMEEIALKREMLINQAYEEGKEKARQEAIEQIREEMKDALNKTKEIYDKANEYYQGIISQSEEKRDYFLEEKRSEIINFVVLLTKKLFEVEVEINDEKINDVYEKALAEIKYETKKIDIRIHPKTETVLKKHGKMFSDERIVWLKDTSIDYADIVIETDIEFIDKRIDYLLSEIKEFLKGVVISD
jgi:flagellar biosynthesis/type III secretory pathway protein FliH